MNARNFMSGTPLDFTRVAILEKNWVVYLLVKNGEIIYVGKSSYTRYAHRIKQHMKNKQFDDVYVAQVSDSEYKTLAVESSFISMLQPKYNIAGNSFDYSKISKGLAIVNENQPKKNIDWFKLVGYISIFVGTISYTTTPIVPLWIVISYMLYIFYITITGLIQYYSQSKPQSASC